MADLFRPAISFFARRHAMDRSFYVIVAGLGLAIVMLVVFHAMVQGAVQKAQSARLSLVAATERSVRCVDALRAPAGDLCMLQVAVSPRLVHPAGARTRGTSGLQARAD